VLVTHERSALRITTACARARKAGAIPGDALSDVRARVPALVVAHADPAGDLAALERLARRMRRWSPWVKPVTEGTVHGIALDITGVAHLFGDETGLVSDMTTTLTGAGLAGARIALAPGFAAAWALAVAGRSACIRVDSQRLVPALAPLPVEVLRLPPAIVRALRLAGLRTIGHVLAGPRAVLGHRFGALVGTRLDTLMGKVRDPLDPLPHRTRPHAVRRLLEPVSALEALQALAGDLAADLATRLQEAGLGARRLSLRLWRVDGIDLQIDAAASTPEADAGRLARLLCHRLEAGADRLDPGFGIEGGLLMACDPVRRAARQVDLDPDAAERAGAREAARNLADRLRARLGAERVRRPRLNDAWLPEDAEDGPGGTRPADIPALVQPCQMAPGRTRPTLVYRPPEPAEAVAEAPDGPPRLLRWRRQILTIVAADGPERLCPPWWRGHEPTRDYYRVETADGRRLWVFRAGMYGAPADTAVPQDLGAPPPPSGARWFVHGRFG